MQDVPGTLDLDRLAAVAPALLGLHDFAAFCKRREGATTVRTLLDLRAGRVATGPLAGVVEVTVRADAFCHSMVRSLVGALVAVADGRRDPTWLIGLLDAPGPGLLGPGAAGPGTDAGGGRLPRRRRAGGARPRGPGGAGAG